MLEVAFPCGTLEEMDEKATMSANVGVPPFFEKIYVSCVIYAK